MIVPPSGPLFAAVDVGTTGARAVAVDLRGRLIAEERRPYQTSMPHRGWAEQDPRDWTGHAVDALRGLARRVGDGVIGAIGLTGQCPTVAPFDAAGRPVGPGMMYRDNRAVAEAAEMRERLGVAEMHLRTGHTAEAFHVGPKVLWLRRHRPEVFRRTRVLLQPRDVVLHRMTGRLATDESHANATLFFDLMRRCWALDLLAEFDLDPGLFPPALPPWAVAAPLPSRMAEEVGLRPGIPVVIGAGDSQCVAFGAGVHARGPVSEMAGASSCLNSAVTTPRRDVRITHYSHAVPGQLTTELGMNTTGAAIAWALDRLGFQSYDEFAAAAEAGRKLVVDAQPDDAVGAAPFFLPYLGDGERDDPVAQGGLVGVSDRHDRSAVAYAVAEGVALGVARVVGILRRSGCPVEELRVAGGGARLHVLGQIKADALGVPVLHLDVDASALGAALLGARAAGYADEADDAIATVLARARRFDPEARGRDAAVVRGRAFAALRRRWRR